MCSNRTNRRIWAVALSLALVLTGCRAPARQQPEEKVAITVWVDTPINGMDLYWSKLAAKFPDIKLDVTYQENMVPEAEIARRVAHGDVADLVFSQYLPARGSGSSGLHL